MMGSYAELLARKKHSVGNFGFEPQWIPAGDLFAAL
jgi:hypothetical protein